MTTRKIFYEDGFPCVASGILFYKPSQKRFLMLDVDGMFEDAGGKTELTDTSTLHTAFREAYEELNGILPCTFNEIFPRIIKKIFIRNIKYMVFIVKVSDSWCNNTNIFGDVEKFNKTKRTVKWVNVIEHTKLHYRLRGISRMLQNMVKHCVT